MKIFQIKKLRSFLWNFNMMRYFRILQGARRMVQQKSTGLHLIPGTANGANSRKVSDKIPSKVNADYNLGCFSVTCHAF